MRNFINKVGNGVKSNSPTLLSGVAVAGVVSTAYLTGRGAIKAHAILREDRYSRPEGLERRDRVRRDVRLVWRCYIPAALSGTVTVGCILGASKISNHRAAAAHAAFVISERAYSEYRDKVIEEVGEKKEEMIRAAVAEERMRKNPPPTTEVMFVGPGNVLCCEMYTGRYFASDMETLRKKVNDLNAYLLIHDTATLDDWYDMIGLGNTQFSSDMGWCSDKMVELEFASTLTEDGRPCLSFEYNYLKPAYEGLNG